MKNAHISARVAASLLRPSRIAAVMGAFLFAPMAGNHAMVFAPAPAQAQNLFAPAAYVNDEVITYFEIEQRRKFLTILNAKGDIGQLALEALIEDRLRMSEAKRFDFTLSDEQLRAGMAEFAQRAGLTTEQLLAELAKAGVAEETFRDFVRAGATWREVIRGRFGSNIKASEAEVDIFLEAQTRSRALRVLVSELVIPVPQGEEQEAYAFAQGLATELGTFPAFAQAAREYSASPTASDGGKVSEWLALAELPPPVAAQLSNLQPGEVSEPLMVPGAVVLFQLRDIAQDNRAAPIQTTLEWAQMLAPSDSEAVTKMRRDADTCNDLYAYGAGLPAQNLEIVSKPASAVPHDIALQLARLNINEYVVEPRPNGMVRVLMLCKRLPQADEAPDRARVKDILINQKIEGIAANYLEDLRHSAIIRTK